MATYLEGLSKPVYRKWKDVGEKKRISFKNIHVLKHENIKLAEFEKGYVQLCDKLGCLNQITKGNLCKTHNEGKEKYRYCRYEGICGTKASCGYEHKKPLFCKKHKEEDMYDVISKLCEVLQCKIHASFGIEGGVPQFCVKHKKSFMIDLKHNTCEFSRCSTRPTFGIKGGSARYCSEHRKEGMIDLCSKKCEFFGCNIQASFGFKDNKKQFCVEHKKEEMINLAAIYCEEIGCTTCANFGFFGDKRRFCLKHKKDNMVDITIKHCEFEGCIITASYCFEGETPRFCTKHKKYGMKNLYAKRCETPGCDIISNFGHIGEIPRFCSVHREQNMICLTRKNCISPNCSKAASYSKLYSKDKTHCQEHVTLNEYQKSIGNPRCCKADCLNTAYYYDIKDENLYPIRCSNHALPTDIKLVEKQCKQCNDILHFPENRDICMECGKYRPEMPCHFKEALVKNFLQCNNIDHKYDTRISFKGSLCRPDFVINATFGKIILEVDEFQHKYDSQYTQEKEMARMKTIYQDAQIEFPNTQILFIRFNPDKYTGEKYTMDMRLNYLHKLLTQYTEEQDINTSLGVQYLFYDGFVTERNKIEPISL